MSLLRLGLIGVAWLGLPGCIDNTNDVGSISAGGGDNPIVVGGAGGNAAAGNGSSTGGTGSGPGSSGGAGAGAGATAVVTCRGNGQQILLSKTCQSAAGCTLISGSGSIAVPGTVTTSCTTLTVSISRAEEARFQTFVDNCPPPVGSCSLAELKVQTEDGRVVPASATIAAECDVDTCKSYAP